MPKSSASSISDRMSADPQHRLGRDAGVVQAAPADAVLLHDGGLHPELRGADRRHVAARPRADDDAVVRALGHGRRTLATVCSAGQRWPGGRHLHPRHRPGRASRTASRRTAMIATAQQRRPRRLRGHEQRAAPAQMIVDAEQRLERQHRPVARAPHADGGGEHHAAKTTRRERGSSPRTSQPASAATMFADAEHQRRRPPRPSTRAAARPAASGSSWRARARVPLAARA